MTHQCIVVGGGPAGLAAGTALARCGVEVLLVGAPAPAGQGRDNRTAALFPPAIRMLEALGAWDAVAQVSAPLRAIRLVDGTQNLLRAPEVLFRASDIPLPDIGYNVPNSALVAALWGAARRVGLTIVDNALVKAVVGTDIGVDIVLDDGRKLDASLVVGADGRQSICRAAAGIPVRRWRYEQAAITCSFRHTRAHEGISTEIHGPAGPCTTVPLPGRASSLVWMERTAEAARLMALDDGTFIAALEARLGGLLGDISELEQRRSFPLEGLVASTMAQRCIALVGESAHAFPPIGAQGLNLGLADAAALADCVGDANAAGRNVGGASVTAAYSSLRIGDIQRRVGAVDLLNRSLEPSMLPLGLARGAGLHLLAASSALRRRLMLEGLFPPRPLPRLMREPVTA